MTEESTPRQRAARERRPAEHGYRTTHRASRPAVSLTWMWIAAAAVAVVLVLVVAVDAFASAGRVHPGVTVAGIGVGGMTPSEATAALERDLPAKASQPVTVVYGEKTWTVPPADLALTFDYPELAAEAMAVGRTGGFCDVCLSALRSVARQGAPARGRRRRSREDEEDP